MYETIKNILKKYEETIRYLICGVLTVIVNTVLYLLLAVFLEDIIANTISFFLSVLFAYFTNSIFVFRTPVSKETFFKFFGMRIGTLVIDNGGMWLLLSMNVNKLFSKCAVNIIIIVLNYIFSKFWIFKTRKDENK
ncbi:MAG: GtrA family protein [Oscillospiraceae bacterium]|nr:GtrA family protein [Oscillospiraceae bacterium]